MHPSIVILDFGSQYTQLIARRIRALEVHSVILPPGASLAEIQKYSPLGIILSGGPASVYEKKSPKPAPGVLDSKVPILGICYGMQALMHLSGGKIEASDEREYGFAKLDILSPSALLEGVSQGSQIWMSHADKVTALAPGYKEVAKSDFALAAIENAAQKRYAVQFHPEVVHSLEGTKIISNFIFKICGAKREWTMPAFIEETCEKLRAEVGKRKVVLGLSGGVDSSVLAILLHKALGDRLTCVFVDNGLLRHGEAKKVKETFQKHYKIKLKVVDASKKFLTALKGVTDPEKKRKIIGKVFVDVFFKSVPNFHYLAQGTLYPDVIESVATRGPSDKIKTHHNRVDQILKLIKAGRIIEPFAELFKDEVRLIGKSLGMPDEIIHRQPFPGPGLAIRVLGEITKDRLESLRDADRIVLEEIKAAGLYEKLWQAFAVLLPIRSVGVMGDNRTYGHTIAIRAVESVDGMTADFFLPPKPVLTRIVNRIIGEVRAVNRVVLDVTSKPPGTIEWE